MIRFEGIITALIGGTLGVAVGAFLAILTTQALSDQGVVFAIPWMTMAVFVFGTTAAGLLASIMPARRASGLNILKALQYE
jgi:putative ABC transport system permease protein